MGMGMGMGTGLLPSPLPSLSLAAPASAAAGGAGASSSAGGAAGPFTFNPIAQAGATMPRIFSPTGGLFAFEARQTSMGMTLPAPQAAVASKPVVVAPGVAGHKRSAAAADMTIHTETSTIPQAAHATLPEGAPFAAQQQIGGGKTVLPPAGVPAPIPMHPALKRPRRHAPHHGHGGALPLTSAALLGMAVCVALYTAFPDAHGPIGSGAAGLASAGGEDGFGYGAGSAMGVGSHPRMRGRFLLDVTEAHKRSAVAQAAATSAAVEEAEAEEEAGIEADVEDEVVAVAQVPVVAAKAAPAAKAAKGKAPAAARNTVAPVPAAAPAASPAPQAVTMAVDADATATVVTGTGTNSIAPYPHGYYSAPSSLSKFGTTPHQSGFTPVSAKASTGTGSGSFAGKPDPGAPGSTTRSGRTARRPASFATGALPTVVPAAVLPSPSSSSSGDHTGTGAGSSGFVASGPSVHPSLTFAAMQLPLSFLNTVTTFLSTLSSTLAGKPVPQALQTRLAGISSPFLQSAHTQAAVAGASKPSSTGTGRATGGKSHAATKSAPLPSPTTPQAPAVVRTVADAAPGGSLPWWQPYAKLGNDMLTSLLPIALLVAAAQQANNAGGNVGAAGGDAGVRDGSQGYPIKPSQAAVRTQETEQAEEEEEADAMAGLGDHVTAMTEKLAQWARGMMGAQWQGGIGEEIATL